MNRDKFLWNDGDIVIETPTTENNDESSSPDPLVEAISDNQDQDPV